jgi:hypothetical protein
MRSFLTAVLVAAVLAVGISPVAAQEGTPVPGNLAGISYTNIRFFLPYTPDGLAPGLTVTTEASGVCLEQSLADIGRSDAWVCADAMNNEHYDPCFENPFAAIDDESELICATSPFSTDVVRFTLTEPLRREKDVNDADIAPAPPAMPDEAAPRRGRKARQDAAVAVADPPPPPVDTAEAALHPYDIPWGLELANGERCTLLTGATAVMADERINYGCESGGLVIGEVDRSGPVWMVSFLASDAYASDYVPVTVAWT